MEKIESLIQQIKKDFPSLQQGDKTLHYLDNAATTLKPRSVIQKIVEYYEEYPANIYRGLYTWSKKASVEFDLARQKVAQFIGSKQTESIIFTSGATASSNLFSRSFCQKFLKAGDEIILSSMDHHSNIVNWIKESQDIGFKIIFAPLNKESLTVDISAFYECFSEKTKLVSLVHISNLTGSVNDIKKMVQISHGKGVPFCVDISQTVAHQKIDLSEWDVDFAFFSGHKMFAPTGIGVFYMKKEWLSKLPLFFHGGGMVSSVSQNSFVAQNPPNSFEAGTPPIAQAIGLGASIDYILNIGWDNISQIEKYLTTETKLMFKKHPQAQVLVGLSQTSLSQISLSQISLFSFNIEGIHPHDVAAFLDENKVAVRIGKHCTSLFLEDLKINAVVRASFSIYNDKEDIDALSLSLQKAKEFFYES